MIKMLAWFGKAWPTWPRPVRQIILVMAFGFAFGTGIVLGPQILRGWLPENLVNVPTKQDLHGQFEDLKEETASHTTAVVATAMANLTDSLHRERRLAEDSILHPMLSNQFELFRRVKRVENLLGVTNTHISTMRDETSQQLERLVQHSQQDDTRTEQECRRSSIGWTSRPSARSSWSR